MLANVALDGAVGIVPIAGDAFDVMFRANVRNVRMLKRWMEKQPCNRQDKVLKNLAMLACQKTCRCHVGRGGLGFCS